MIKEWDDLITLRKNMDIKRMGIPFSTESRKYYYDTGTGKVIELEEPESRIVNSLFDFSMDEEELRNVISSVDNNEEILEFIVSENLFQHPAITKFIPLHKRFKEENMEIQQLIIELTGKCNLRCKYCIYNDYYEGNRNFNTSDITFETAKKAIDYVYAHRAHDRLAITFYGGEPLANFPVMKQCIGYSLEHLKDCNLSFSFTTNLTLMTEEIAEYLGKVPEMSIILSMDGPAEIHNMSRVYSNNRPTFDDAYRGLRYIAEAAKKYGNINLTFNSVLMPPYTYERFDKINDFFSGLDFMPEGTKVQASYPSKDTVPESYILELKEKGYRLSEIADWFSWADEHAKGKDFINDRMNLYSNVLETSLAKIHNRLVFDEPIDFCYFNGCCIPGQRRLYVSTNGEYRVCERVGKSPCIGHVDTGIDLEATIKYYIDQYEEKSIKHCSKCWALRLCDICYADCYDENGINIETKSEFCTEVRDRYKQWLIRYYTAVENNLDLIKDIDKVEFS